MRKVLKREILKTMMTERGNHYLLIAKNSFTSNIKLIKAVGQITAISENRGQMRQID